MLKSVDVVDPHSFCNWDAIRMHVSEQRPEVFHHVLSKSCSLRWRNDFAIGDSQFRCMCNRVGECLSELTSHASKIGDPERSADDGRVLFIAMRFVRLDPLDLFVREGEIDTDIDPFAVGGTISMSAAAISLRHTTRTAALASRGARSAFVCTTANAESHLIVRVCLATSSAFFDYFSKALAYKYNNLTCLQ